jgi:hypothetical protein
VVLGYQALEVELYSYTPNYGWMLEKTFITPVLITSEIISSTLTLRLYVNVTFISPSSYGGTYDVTSNFAFGSSTYESGLFNLQVSTPRQSEIQKWRFESGDYIGFTIGAYYDLIGAGVYALLLLLFSGVLYFRYGHGGTVAFFFVLFGGVGGLVWVFLPLWAATPAAIIIILLVTILVWRLIR